MVMIRHSWQSVEVVPLVDYVRVANILERPLFKDAVVVAGRSGLSRRVRWVHVGEVPNISDYLRGDELILTTGISLQSRETREAYMKSLANTAGIILECGTYLQEAPPDMVDMADRLGLPLIAMRHPVRFLDLSHDINTMIVSRHHRILDDLESLSMALRRALLYTEGIGSIIQELMAAIHFPVSYVSTVFGQFHQGSVPTVASEQLYRLCREEEPRLDPVYETLPDMPPHLRQTVSIGNHRGGELLVWIPDVDTFQLDELYLLAMDRTATALAQDHLRTQSERERQLQDDMLVADNLLNPRPHGLTAGDDVLERYHLPKEQFLGWVMGLRPAAELPPSLWHQCHSEIKAVLKTLNMAGMVLPQGLSAFWVILSNRRQKPPALSDWQRWLSPVTDHFPVLMALSDPVKALDKLPQAKKQVHETFVAMPYFPDHRILAYQQIGLFRLLVRTPMEDLKEWLVEYELAPVLRYDQAHNTNLKDTLRVLLTYPESRKQAADKLYIHRQTLYNRLRLLQRILGADFLSASRRLTLQLALIAHDYLEQMAHE